MKCESLAIKYEDGKISVLDQSLLPKEETWIESHSIDEMCAIIKALKVRGAPLIGVAAALALAQYAQQGATIEQLNNAGKQLIQARPTAVNLPYCVNRMLTKLNGDPKAAIAAAKEIFDEDVALCEAMAEHGSQLIPKDAILMTHCNAGSLATAGVGTAIGVIKRAFEQGKVKHVYVNETRPLLQGARLTAWELKKAGIPYTLICDSMAASVMRDKDISAIIVGADRIAANGDVANKIGTYSLACLAKAHDIPFYVAAPYTTLDKGCENGTSIVIEQREACEVTGALGKIDWAPEGTEVHNPAFDVTPATFITKYILDTGNLSKDQLLELTRVTVSSPEDATKVTTVSPVAVAFEVSKKNTPSLKKAAQTQTSFEKYDPFTVRKDGGYMSF